MEPLLRVAVCLLALCSAQWAAAQPAYPAKPLRIVVGYPPGGSGEHEAGARVLAKPEVREKIASQGMDATPSASPEAFAADIRAESPAMEKVVRESGQKVE